MLKIEWTGQAHGDDADEDRAISAAQAVFAAAGISATDAHAEFVRLLDEGDEGGCLWLRAEIAALDALSEGWGVAPENASLALN